MNRLVLFTVSLIGLSACGAPSAPLSTESTDQRPSFQRVRFNFKVPAAGLLVVTECPPLEAVEIIKGMFHFQGFEERAADGTLLSVTVHFNAMGVEGIGLTSGLRYRALDNDKSQVVFTSGEEFVSQETDVRYRLIRQGSLDNMWVRATFLFTPPDHFEFTRSEFECRG